MRGRLYEERAYGPEPDAGNYWRTTTPAREVPALIEEELRCDIAVIGGGFTGLNAALELANAGADVALFDAQTPGFGASGRNGGFACIGGDKMSISEMTRTYGADEAATYHKAQRAAIDLVAERLDRLNINADRHSNGETQLAHSQRAFAAFDDEAEILQRAYGVKCEVQPRDALSELGLSSPTFHGALTLPLGFALNPLKYAMGLVDHLLSRNVPLYRNALVTHIERQDSGWVMRTEKTLVRAKKVILATNGYSSDSLPSWMAGRYLPVQSNVLVTRPLTDDEIKAQGFFSHQMCYDSRNLVHYFRLMPNRQMLFGLRGAVKATAKAHEGLGHRIRAHFRRMFPAWSEVEAPYYWSGLLAINSARRPFAGALTGLPDAFGAFCYHGNGVAMASYCGRLIAHQALGNPAPAPHPEFMKSAPSPLPLGRYRRALLPLAYARYTLEDHFG